MIEVYRDRDSATVGLLQSILEAEGIATFMRNQVLSGTEVTIPSFYPALCVMRKEDVERARILIEAAKGERDTSPSSAVEDWVCQACGETNPGGFEVCWNCEVALAPEEES